MDEASIGARLRILRRWRGMTQVELAGLADLSPSFVSMVETGQRPLDRRSHIGAIASALRVSETDLVRGPHLTPDPVAVRPAYEHSAIAGRDLGQHAHESGHGAGAGANGPGQGSRGPGAPCVPGR